jgi:hypothetical protein
MSSDQPVSSAACCPVHALGKCDAVFTCCDRCPTFFGPEGDCTPEEAVEAVKAVRASAACPHCGATVTLEQSHACGPYRAARRGWLVTPDGGAFHMGRLRAFWRGLTGSWWR